MTRPRPPTFTSIRDLIVKSDFARLNPGRVAEILDRCADPSGEDRLDPTCKEIAHGPAD